jgi:hypothetical protein
VLMLKGAMGSAAQCHQGSNSTMLLECPAGPAGAQAAAWNRPPPGKSDAAAGLHDLELLTCVCGTNTMQLSAGQHATCRLSSPCCRSDCCRGEPRRALDGPAPPCSWVPPCAERLDHQAWLNLTYVDSQQQPARRAPAPTQRGNNEPPSGSPGRAQGVFQLTAECDTPENVYE